MQGKTGPQRPALHGRDPNEAIGVERAKGCNRLIFAASRSTGDSGPTAMFRSPQSRLCTRLSLAMRWQGVFARESRRALHNHNVCRPDDAPPAPEHGAEPAESAPETCSNASRPREQFFKISVEPGSRLLPRSCHQMQEHRRSLGKSRSTAKGLSRKLVGFGHDHSSVAKRDDDNSFVLAAQQSLISLTDPDARVMSALLRFGARCAQAGRARNAACYSR